jgi:integrase/recombinase XerD
VSIYTRSKNAKGQWRYEKVKTGRGIKTGGLKGPFHLRYTTDDGKQAWWPDKPEQYEDALELDDKIGGMLAAKQQGLTIAEYEDRTNANRVPIKIAIEGFLEQKKNKAKKTVAAYTLHLHDFMDSLPSKTRFVDEITAATLRGYKSSMEEKGFAGKTIHNRLLTVLFLLKEHGIKNPLKWSDMPTIEDEPAVAYTDDELKKLFATMNEEESIRYKFFLGSGCRDKEVTFAAWQDIDFSKATFHIRRKEDVGFTPKTHESRTVPLPEPLVRLLRERHQRSHHPRWIFTNTEENPDNHFLRKLKIIAIRAGLNCGQCKTILSRGSYARRRRVEVTCATEPVCQHWYLHRLRKTCATRWQEHGIPVRTIQAWLGHKNLETTMIYLGVTDVEKLRTQIDRAFGD